MKVKRIIKFTGKNLNDVFNLPCVKCILKTEDNEPLLVLWPDVAVGVERACAIGGTLIEYSNGHWQAER